MSRRRLRHVRRLRLRLPLLLSLLVAVFLHSPPSAAQEATCGGAYDAIADAAVSETSPGGKFGRDAQLTVERRPEGDWRSLIAFDLGRTIAPGTTIHAAILELFIDDSSGTFPYELEIRAVGDPWDEAAVTWETQPPPGVLVGRFASSVIGGVVRIDVTPLVTRWVNGEQRGNSLVLLPAVQGTKLFAGSREASAPGHPGPLLVVSCSLNEPPQPPDQSVKDAAQVSDLERLAAASLRPPRVRLGAGAVRFADFELPVPGSVAPDPLARARWFLGKYRALMRIDDPDAELQLSRRSADGEHLFFRQRHNGIPVFPAEIAVHLDPNSVTGLSGDYAPEITVGSTPRLTAEQAAAIALEGAGEGAAVAGDVQLRYVNLSLLGISDPSTHLAWQVPVAGGALGGTVFIDATTGALLYRRPPSRDAFDLTLNTAQGDIPHGSDPFCWFFANLDVEWFTERGPVSNPTPPIDAEGNSAFANITAVNNYWRTILGRDGHNGSGGQEGQYIHVTFRPEDSGPDNAHYAPWCNILEFSNNMSTRDVTGHEFTHGVIRFEADLEYLSQSGALNESYADLFGFLVDPNNWTMGEGSAIGVLRNLSDPPSRGQPDHMNNWRTRTLDPNGDFGGVHVNDGIPNKAGSLIIAGGTHNGFPIGGLGRSLAAHLFYNVIANRLTRTSQFIDARDGAVAEAAAMGLSTRERCDVRNAYASVGVGVGDMDCDGTDDTIDPDSDGDGVPNSVDNCPTWANPGQSDVDGDGKGDTCDTDMDGDGVLNTKDNCPLVRNSNQADWDFDKVGDVCDDSDGDGIMDSTDNCREDPNPDQRDTDHDGRGDACDVDMDNDTRWNSQDNCPLVYNSDQLNDDGDTYGDACDKCRGLNSSDNSDTDRDGLGNPCDPDDDNDGVLDGSDNCPSTYNPVQSDFDSNGVGTPCDNGELMSLYADVSSIWNHPWTVRFPEIVQIPIVIPVPVPLCPRCGWADLPKGFDVAIDLEMSTPFRARIVDGEGFTLSAAGEGALIQSLRFGPAPFGMSRFTFPMSVKGDGIEAASPASPDFMRSDQIRYSIEIFPEPGTDLRQPYTLQVGLHECQDADMDGFGYPGDPVCPGGPLPDCDDASAARFPGNPEICDGADNDCDGFPDGFITSCGAGACSRTGSCEAGLDTCAAGSPSPEVCDGVDNDCDGLADNTPLPGALSGVTIRQSDLQWPSVPLASGYDIVRGDLGTMSWSGGDFTAATTNCLGHDQAPASISDTQVPAPGQGFWYLVRALNCGGPGTYDTASPPQQGSRDAEIAASPYQCAGCPHDACFPAARLSSGCGACEAAIIAVDPYCGLVAWDSICVTEVRTICGSLRCWESQGFCTHALCSTGAPLTAGCDSPPVFPSCASAICSTDPYCCATGWDETCASEVATICGWNCG